MSEFTKDILQARKAKGMTQEQLASAMGVSRQLVSHWENGRAEPTAQQREKLNEVLRHILILMRYLPSVRDRMCCGKTSSIVISCGRKGKMRRNNY